MAHAQAKDTQRHEEAFSRLGQRKDQAPLGRHQPSGARKSQKRIRKLRGTDMLAPAMAKAVTKALAGNSY